MHQTAVMPDVFSYNAAISACEKDQQWRQAFGLLAVMQQAAVMHRLRPEWQCMSGQRGPAQCHLLHAYK